MPILDIIIIIIIIIIIMVDGNRLLLGARACSERLAFGAFDPATFFVLPFRADISSSAINLRIVPCPPLDARGLPTFN